MSNEKGFTLIELVVVIVILGILAATALPRFIDIGADAAQAAVDGTAGALSSAASVNYAGRLVNSTNGVSVGNCQDVSSALQSGLPSTDYTITSTTAVTSGGTAQCTLSATINGSTYNATFTAIGIS